MSKGHEAYQSNLREEIDVLQSYLDEHPEMPGLIQDLLEVELHTKERRLEEAEEWFHRHPVIHNPGYPHQPDVAGRHMDSTPCTSM